jgi:RNA polymerase-binding transcription factor DksA
MVARSQTSCQSIHDDAQIRSRLDRERRRLTDLIAALEAEGLDLESEAASIGELAEASQHQADLGSETFERERDLTLLDEFRDGLREVNEAAERLAAGVYGYCRGCSQPIDPNRLEALPAAPFCKACEERYELTGALEERAAEPTIGVAADGVEFLPDDDFEPVSTVAEGPGDDALDSEMLEGATEGSADEDGVNELLDGSTVDVEADRFEESAEDDEFEGADELEADLFTAIRRQLGDHEEPDLERVVEPNGEVSVWLRQPNEFLCTSCFQLKLRAQLADALHGRCVDCVNNGTP